jgi:hypothetical protein
MAMTDAVKSRLIGLGLLIGAVVSTKLLWLGEQLEALGYK